MKHLASHLVCLLEGACSQLCMCVSWMLPACGWQDFELLRRGGAALCAVPARAAHAVPGHALPVCRRPGPRGLLGVLVVWPAQQQAGAITSMRLFQHQQANGTTLS